MRSAISSKRLMVRAARLSYAALLVSISGGAVWAGQADSVQSLQSILTAAQEAQERSNFAAAAGYYRQAVKISPNVAELWANLGLMDEMGGNNPEAIKSFTEAARLNGSMFVPQLFLGIEYLKLNRAETAIPFLQRAEQLNPKDPQAPLALGRAFAITGKGDRASDAYSRALAIAPDDGNAWLGLGMAQLQQASADDRAMTETYKDSVYAKLRAAETFAEQGKLDQAAAAYRSVLETKSPPPACAHAAYGIVLLRQQEVAKAQAEFEQELSLNPGCDLGKLGIAAIQLIQGNAEDALKGLVALWDADQGFLGESLPLLRDALSESQREQLLRMAQDLEARKDNPSESADALHTEPQSDKLASKEAEALYSSGQYQKCSESMKSDLSALPET
jgi:tetratricopeptide (TPR) repeat protein